MITIFTDGSSRGNPGPGGWGAIIITEGEAKTRQNVLELGGREEHTTNNRMELVAAIEALATAASAPGFSSEKITVNADSSYVIHGITKWIHGWKKKNWKTLDKKDVVNRDLWERLDEIVSRGNVAWNYVGGHVGIAGNERCDTIATSYADNTPVSLFSGLFSDYFIPHILDISASAEISGKKSSSKSRSNTAAYSYVSSVGGVIAVDRSWKECEARVKGKRGARYKKSLNASEESDIIADFRKIL